MTITIGWAELVVLGVVWVVAACVKTWVEANAPSGIDSVPGSGMAQAPDAEEAEGRLGFRPR